MPRIVILSNPRSGSTYLRGLLNSHPDIYIDEELLNDEVDIEGDPLVHLDKVLSTYSQTTVGFKVFPEQIFERGLRFDQLIREIGATQIIVLWREGILETLTSRRIADKTGIWYSTDAPTSVEKIHIAPEDLEKYTETTVGDWNKIGDQWPKGIKPIFLKFEYLISDPMVQIRDVLSKLGCPSEKIACNSPSKRQNPAKLAEKVVNFADLGEDAVESKLNVKEVLESKIPRHVQLPPEVSPFAPDREPCIPPQGWRYRVAEPFMPSGVKQNVYDAVESGSVSSAGFWPRMMSSKLKELFRVPVAQPCSNGFSALMLAMQSVHISKGDEVIMPTMTMVAVPNAVHFLGATPVFVDCVEGNYNPGWGQIEKMSSDKTKAVIVTHTYGVPTPEMDKIVEECAKRGWWLIEDISECVGVKTRSITGDDKLLGTFGHFAIASLYVNKMIHAGDGGFVIAKDPKLAMRLSSLVNHGFTPYYHFVHYEPSLNAKINGLGAAIACGCIDEIDFIMDHRAQVSRMYRRALEKLPIKLMPVCGELDTPWVFGLECESKAQRTELRAFLAERRIETRDYFFSLHLQPAYWVNSDGQCQQRLPISEKLGSTGFYLPTHSNLNGSDVEYITSCIRQFFQPQNGEVILLNPPVANPNLAVQVTPGSFKLEVRKFNESGSLNQVEFRGHAYIEAVRIGLEADALIIEERWDNKVLLIHKINKCLESAKGLRMHSEMTKFFQPYLNYFESQVLFEQPTVKTWLGVDLNAEVYIGAQEIPTTTDSETLQLLLWLVEETRSEVIWEIGCWMGHASYRMASLGKSLGIRQKVFACDAFRWQDWMSNFLKPEMILQPRQSFKKHFQHFTQKVSDSIEAVDWHYDLAELPIVLVNQKPNLVFLDMTQEDEEIESIWQLILPNLIPNETIILFNGLSHKSIPFFTRHADVLVGIAKPNTIAKAFRFISKPPVENVKNIEDESSIARLPKKLNFQSDPGWTHHHKNLFCSSVALLRDQFHHDNSPIMFFPAVEEKICDEPDLFLSNPWVGIAHSVAEYPDLFYTPDLKRLCSPKYRKIMNNCRGLFTLTEFQAEFLKSNLPQDLHKFPIQPLKYPLENSPSGFQNSNVPEIWKSGGKVDLVFIGSFARDFQLFFDTKVPSNMRKVLVASDEISHNAAKNAPPDVTVLGRLSGEEYEVLLSNSIVFLSLKYDGASNTIILECIARNVPILSPRLSSCTEYLGSDYPLLFDPYDPKSDGLDDLLTLKNIESAIFYLKTKEKSPFSVETFVSNFEKGAVLGSVAPMSVNSNNLLTPSGITNFPKYDVTICICSYKRTHHLSKIIKSLWEGQDFGGSFQIIVWNNNEGRTGIVHQICKDYVQKSNSIKSLELINSTQNYFCSVRFAMPALMKSDCLLICDDDVIPGSNFVTFFTSAHSKNPNDVLCVRGHVFLPHELKVQDPSSLWVDYESLRFKDDDAPEQLIHFVHADACLIPKAALREIASVEMPDQTFDLVDDYWMSFILNHRFGRKLRKISVAGLAENPINRTDDSNSVGLALHTRPEVHDARIRLYTHHMLQGWPEWPTTHSTGITVTDLALKTTKSEFWDHPELGYNIFSKISESDLKDLCRIGTKSVRIGAVGIGEQTDYDLCGFLTDPEGQLTQLSETVDLLRDAGISVILTLERRLVNPDVWKLIASKFATYPNVVGYDLINEPFTEGEINLHWTEFEGNSDSEGLSILKNTYTELIKCIREVDQVTPIIIESSYWGRIYSLTKLPISELKDIDSNLIVSFHFYEPMLLTRRQRNRGRFCFPGPVSTFDNLTSPSQQITWTQDLILKRFQEAKSWSDSNGVRCFLGEFGISRDISGAGAYLKAVIEACQQVRMSGYIFSFRDGNWEAMDYELGTDLFNQNVPGNWEGNGLMDVIIEGFGTFNRIA